MNSDLFIKLLIQLILINGESYLKIKVINNDKKVVFMQNNLNYYSVRTYKYKSYGLVFVMSNPIKEREFSLKCRKKRGYTCWLMRYDTCSAYENIFKRKRRVTGFQWERRANNHINKNAPILSLAPGDSLVQIIKTHPNLFLKTSYCNHGLLADCPPFEDDSLKLYAFLKFKYSYAESVKPKDFSFFYLSSDTLTLNLR